MKNWKNPSVDDLSIENTFGNGNKGDKDHGKGQHHGTNGNNGNHYGWVDPIPNPTPDFGNGNESDNS